MSPPDSTDARRGIRDDKPRADIYTVLLGISLAAILVAILCLALELNRYEGNIDAQGVHLPAQHAPPAAGQVAFDPLPTEVWG